MLARPSARGSILMQVEIAQQRRHIRAHSRACGGQRGRPRIPLFPHRRRSIIQGIVVSAAFPTRFHYRYSICSSRLGEAGVNRDSSPTSHGTMYPYGARRTVDQSQRHLPCLSECMRPWTYVVAICNQCPDAAIATYDGRSYDKPLARMEESRDRREGV